MVEYLLADAGDDLGTIFKALADETRRDILRRVSKYQLTVGQLASHSNLTFAAISKHLKVLEKAGLIINRRIGRKHYIALQPAALKEVTDYLEWYSKLWEGKLDSLEIYINESEV